RAAAQAATADTCAVEHAVEAPVGVDNGRDRRLHLFGPRHVTDIRVAGRRLDAVDGQHARAGVHECMRDGPADPAGGACYERHLAVEHAHVPASTASAQPVSVTSTSTRPARTAPATASSFP